jgi:hypothetical protein
MATTLLRQTIIVDSFALLVGKFQKPFVVNYDLSGCQEFLEFEFTDHGPRVLFDSLLFYFLLALALLDLKWTPVRPVSIVTVVKPAEISSVAHNNISLFVEKGDRVDLADKLYFANELLLAVPDLDESVLVSCYDHALGQQCIAAGHLVLMLICFVRRQLAKLFDFVVPE